MPARQKLAGITGIWESSLERDVLGLVVVKLFLKMPKRNAGHTIECKWQRQVVLDVSRARIQLNSVN